MERPKQAKSVIFIFHAFSRSKFPPVWPFPIENPYRPLLSIILSYRNIRRLNTANIPPLLAPPNPRCPRTMLDQHKSNMDPCWTNMDPVSQPAGRPAGRPDMGPSARGQCGLGGSIWVPNEIETAICLIFSTTILH